ncbi:MAG: sodium:proton antiporter [Rhodospirillales bacterium]|nr:sodium:proton antiporter [Rhodospirillales bacterium]
MIALIGVVNYHFLNLPDTIGMLIIALAVSILVMGIDVLFPEMSIGITVRSAIISIDFQKTLMHGMLSFLLFAGALHVDLDELMQRKAAISLMASLGVMMSTIIIGYGFYLASGAALMTALVFGALISPTDPVAVMGILKTVKVPKALETKIAGESLFNDGIGIVVFSVLAGIAFPMGHDVIEVSASAIAIFLAQEALGGALLGGVAGYLSFLMLKSMDDYVLEIIISLALVTGVYSLATRLHLSGPIAVVVAGLFIGNKGVRYAMSEKTREHLLSFWHLLDEILNALLFTLIGFEALALDLQQDYVIAGLIAIPIMIVARLLSVSVPIKLLSLGQDFTKGAIPVMTWGGLRGGISVALALSLPAGPERDMILTATYVVVVFSVVVQGLSVGWLIKKVVGPLKS